MYPRCTNVLEFSCEEKYVIKYKYLEILKRNNNNS